MSPLRHDVLLDLTADLLLVARRAGLQWSVLPPALAAALSEAVAEAPLEDDPEELAAARADERAWQRDRGV